MFATLGGWGVPPLSSDEGTTQRGSKTFRRAQVRIPDLGAQALMSRLISLVGVKWSRLRINNPAFPLWTVIL